MTSFKYSKLLFLGILFLLNNIGCNEDDVPLSDEEIGEILLNKYNEQILINRGNQLLNSAITIPHGAYTEAHDSQILSFHYKSNTYTFVVYCALNPTVNYRLYILDSNNHTVFNSSIIENTNLGKPGWAPRCYVFNDYTVRITFTLDKTNVYYRDFDLRTFRLDEVKPVKVKYKLDNGKVSDYKNLTMEIFTEHIQNTTSINLNSPSFNSFSNRSILIEGTDQIQFRDSSYYCTLEILSDNMAGGDTGGISCLMESTDLTNWILKGPVFVSEEISKNRCHEMSMTWLNNKWHGLSRYNELANSGYMYWNSEDGEKWQMQGLSQIPEAVKGYRHSVFVFRDLKLTLGRPLAVIAYQKYYDEGEITDPHTSQRKCIGICVTEDFESFHDIIIIKNHRFMTYPSIHIDGQNILYISWSSGNESFTEYITFSKIDLLKLQLD